MKYYLQNICSVCAAFSLIIGPGAYKAIRELFPIDSKGATLYLMKRII